MKPLLVIKKNPFNEKEVEPRHLLSHRLGFNKGITFFPYTKQLSIDTLSRGFNYEWNMFDNILYDVSNNKYTFHDITEKALINLHPVTDDSPFFFNYELGLPANLIPLIWISVILFSWSLYMFKKNWGVKFNNDDNSHKKHAFRKLSIISFLLGFAYILVESYLFNSLNLNLNNPIKSFSLLLFTFLLGNGLGSLSSHFIINKRMNFVTYSIIALTVVLLLEVFFLLPGLSGTASEPTLILTLIFPAFSAGIPFPLLLKEAAVLSDKNSVAILLGISGIAGFISSTSVFITAMLFGYSYLILIAVVLYLLIIFFASVGRRNIRFNVLSHFIET